MPKSRTNLSSVAEQCQNSNFQSLIYFIERFAPLWGEMNGSMDMLFDQFTDYQSLQDSEYEHIDQIWHYLGSLQDVMVSVSIYFLKL